MEGHRVKWAGVLESGRAKAGMTVMGVRGGKAGRRLETLLINWALDRWGPEAPHADGRPLCHNKARFSNLKGGAQTINYIYIVHW